MDVKNVIGIKPIIVLDAQNVMKRFYLISIVSFVKNSVIFLINIIVLLHRVVISAQKEQKHVILMVS